MSVRSLLSPRRGKSLFWKALALLLDPLLGANKVERMYRTHGFRGLSVDAFTEKCLQVFGITLQLNGPLSQIPATGPLIVCANHPFGGIEGVAVAHLLRRRRKDVKILVNRALGLVAELAPVFIFTNPLTPNAGGNAASLKACLRHLHQGGLLVIFPAGRVSYPAKRGAPVRDHQWNRIVSMLARKTRCPVMPLHISGRNRPLFYILGHLHHRFRMLMLIREMLQSRGKTIPISPGKPSAVLPAIPDEQHMTDLYRLATYLQDPQYRRPWPVKAEQQKARIADAVDGKAMAEELAQLPGEQCLLRYKDFAVYYAMRPQAPNVIDEIRRLREENFRPFDEGSGRPQDGDEFDDTYTHLFVFNHADNAVVGAYRMGRTDRLLAQGGLDALYLSRMFDFSEDFVNHRQPCLEMGRSFVAASYQRSFHGLFLLFKGIGAFVCRRPHYRTLYGTVSLSRRYQPLSILLMEQFLTTPDGAVKAKKPFAHPQHPELIDYLAKHPPDIDRLEWLVKQIEPDGKGLPILLKQYHQLGSRFYCVGIDPNFAGTPGLLLSVNLSATPKKLLKRYMGDQWIDYMAYQQTEPRV